MNPIRSGLGEENMLQVAVSYDRLNDGTRIVRGVWSDASVREPRRRLAGDLFLPE